MDTDVLIVGAGPVGLTMAAALSRWGLSTRLVDQSPTPVQTSNAICIHARTLELLECLDLPDAFVKRGIWIDALELSGAGRVLAHIDFKDLDSKYPGVLSLPQSTTEKLLVECLASSGISVERPLRLVSFEQDASGVTAHLQHTDGSVETIRAAWMIACDGAHSTVRDELRVPVEGTSESEHFVLADLKVTWPLPNNQFSVFLHQEGPVVVVPLPDGEHRVLIDVSSMAVRNEEPAFEEFRVMFARRVPVSASLSEPMWMSNLHIDRRRVANYRLGRIFLAGDAAHIHNPAGGQGVNNGIQDSLNLAWKLALVQSGKAAEALLDSYSAEREPIARGILALTDRLLQAATLQSPMLQRLRDIALPFLAGFEFVQHGILSELTELGLNYRSSPIVRGDGSFESSAPLPGDRAPLPSISDGVSLSRIFEPTAHTLLLFGGRIESKEDVSMLLAIRRDFEAAYPGLIRGQVILHPEDANGFGSLVDQRGGVIHQAYGATKPCLFLIRPDSYVAYRSDAADAVDLHRFVRDCYGFRAAH
jgi:2-polyprenyl-6-methoxyphenol hydroxylase-like FAD-dependent oxidoreductase